MVKNGWRFTVIVGLAIALTGCATNNRSGTGANTGTGTKQQGISNNRAGVSSQGWDNSRNNNFSPSHNNTQMEISNKIADRLTSMDEVDTATVLLTDDNAYVAVILDNGTGYGTTNLGRNVGKANTNRSGTGRTPNAMGNNATTDRMGRQGTSQGNNGITDALKADIAQKVKSVHPNVQNVYVSANPDFVGRMRGYGERFQDGQPIRGMINEFNTLVNRIFPSAE
jgi:YhcN/YlaJ family sporulation lipoprotein